VRRIYWDTMIHAYWFEDNEALSLRVQQIYATMRQRRDILCSSLFVLSELLVGPLKDRNLPAANLIEQFFDSDAVEMLPYSRRSAKTFAELRANHGVKSLDALHLAIATSANVDLFLTHDRRLHKLMMPGLPFIASLDTDLF
jgi:predicted nucleic acid-binding protein